MAAARREELRLGKDRAPASGGLRSIQRRVRSDERVFEIAVGAGFRDPDRDRSGDPSLLRDFASHRAARV